MRSRAIGAAVVFLAACSGGGGGETPPLDVDAEAVPAVAEVSCTGVAPAVTIGTAGGEYSPDPATIAVGQVVRWQMAAGHTVMSRSEWTFAVPQGETRCFRFSAAGAYDYYCQVHGFVGRLTVE